MDYLRASGAVHAERRAMNGAKDRGDVAGIPGVVLEAKSASRVALAAWVDEAEAERINDGAEVAAVWLKRRGKTSPGEGYVVLTGAALVYLLGAAGYIPRAATPDVPAQQDQPTNQDRIGGEGP